MPTTFNGIGTHYVGKKNLSARDGVCRHCGKQATLSSTCADASNRTPTGRTSFTGAPLPSPPTTCPRSGHAATN